MIDLRSDTLTQPTAAMREAMAAASVGDDVFGEDPTVNALEQRIAAMLGKEAALLVPSGTMSNQIGVRLHCQQGDSLIAEKDCHILKYEQAAYAQLWGVGAQPVAGTDYVLAPEQLEDQIYPNNVHFPVTRLLCLENTHNRGGGRVLPYEAVVEVCQWAAARGLARHLDGARLFNAAIASGISASDWAQHFDTVSVCFSKGLGAPVGSALCGPNNAITQARRHRKALGGGMRQAGVLAAAALYALEHHVDRLAEDHAHAQLLADAVEQADGLSLLRSPVESNIVMFDVAGQLGTARQFCAALAQRGVQMMDVAKQRIRAVTHLGVSEAEVREAAQALTTRRPPAQ